MRGILMGMSGRRLNEYIASVKEFSELEEFFDSPVQFYSSGMKSRLGFAASSETLTDVLILDEVLAVGDLGFRIKCYQRINELARNAAVLFVSHSLSQIARMCTRAIVLEKGRLIHDGDVQAAIKIYQSNNNTIPKGKNNRSAFRHDLVSIKLVGDIREVNGHSEINFGDSLGLEVDISKLPKGSRMRVMLKNTANDLLMDWNSVRGNFEWMQNHTRVIVELGPAELSPGVYAINFAALSADGRENLCISDPVYFRVIGKIYGACPIQKIGNWIFVD